MRVKRKHAGPPGVIVDYGVMPGYWMVLWDGQETPHAVMEAIIQPEGTP
jgi:hypothetical protein